MSAMSTAQDTQDPGVPKWTLADRLRKARESADLRQAELASLIGISPRSVTNYERGVEPRRPVLLSWAMACGVKLDWLVTGQAQAPTSPDGGSEQGVAPTIWKTVPAPVIPLRPASTPLREAA